MMVIIIAKECENRGIRGNFFFEHEFTRIFTNYFLLKQKPQKPHSSIKVPRSTNDTIYLFFLVCEHPDKNTYLIS